MEQEDNMPLPPAGPPGNPVRTAADVLQEGLGPEMFGAMQSIFGGFEQQLRAVQHSITVLLRPSVHVRCQIEKKVFIFIHLKSKENF
jgi:hypothetical protein